jgi:hypothetical protein
MTDMTDAEKRNRRGSDRLNVAMRLFAKYLDHVEELKMPLRGKWTDSRDPGQRQREVDFLHKWSFLPK